MTQIKDTYRSIECESEGLFKDNGSRFIALAYPVETVQQVKDILDSLKKEYHDARHHCYAYRIGVTGEPFRANDDGEPSGSAGRQILSQIDSYGLSDVLVVVVRYFGGIKLGIPGLIRAYRTATLDSLSKASYVEKIACSHYCISFNYLEMNNVMKILKDMEIPQYDQDFSESCTLKVKVRLSQVDDFLHRIDKYLLYLNDI